ncbi:lipocalin family protein [Limimaricola hongkongensis]|uniref:lipocalin family protein n=1 Tax=Limimaricola hongkongensis TaxID=278132 RepID=UPI000477332C|nr:lipocalin family protein [Limimaricola hongkongensis]
MTRVAALSALALLAACGAVEAPDPAPVFRAADTPIASSLRGAADDLGGDWVVTAAYPGGPVAPGDRVTLQLDAAGAGVARLVGADAARLVPVTAQGRGRFEIGGQPWWLLWADDDFRTAVIGAPGGAYGWIMDRPGQAGADRARAAREMLDFNSYDTDALTTAREG